MPNVIDAGMRGRGYGADPAAGMLFGLMVGVVETFAVTLTTARFDAPAAAAIVVYDMIGFTAAGAVLGLRRFVVRPPVGPQAVRTTLAGLLALFLIARCAADGLYVVFRHEPGGMALVAARTSMGCLAGALILFFAIRRAIPSRAARSTWALTAGVCSIIAGEILWRRLAGGLTGDLHLIVLVAACTVPALLAVRLAGRLSAPAGAAAVVSVLAACGLLRAVAGPPDFARILREGSAVSSPAPAGAAETGSPNVVLIVLDTLRADHIELYGYERETMPELTRFARTATVYADCLANSSWTLPAHATLFTGLHARQHGARGGSGGSERPGRTGASRLREDRRTLAEILRDRGYATAAIVSNWLYVNPKYGLDQGFDHWDSRPSYEGAAAQGYYPLLLQTRSLLDASPLRWICEPLVRLDVAQLVYRRAEVITDEAIRRLTEHRSNGPRPLFLFLNYMDPHDPYQPPRQFADRFPGRMRGEPRNWKGLSLRRSAFTDERLREHLASQYDSELAYLDAHLGRLLSHLDANGWLDETIVLITSDHGEALLEHGHYHHGKSLYQEELRVPLVVHRPRTDAPSVVDHPVDLRSVMPWILEWLGIPLPEGVLAGVRPGEPLFAELYGTRGIGRGVLKDAYTDQAAIRSGGYKLILSTAGGDELYDLMKDPAEQVDLGGDPARSELGGRLARWMQETVPAGGGEAEPLSPEELRRLEALGYIQ